MNHKAYGYVKYMNICVKRETSHFHVLTLLTLRTALGLLEHVFKDSTLILHMFDWYLFMLCLILSDWSAYLRAAFQLV